MIINNFKTLALASIVGFSSFSAFAQADDMPAKGLVKSMITLPKKQMYAANLVYKAVGADLGKFKLDGWKYKSGTEALTVSNYKSGSKYIATSAPIAVPAVANDESIYLEITEKFSLESDYDFGSVLISADGGNTWQSVHTVTGQSLKRIAQTNISSYAGKTIQIALTVKSDASFEAEGWEVYGIELYRASVGGNTQASSLKSSSLKAGSANATEINITAIHDDNFPEAVYVDFQYLVDGIPQLNLTTDDIKSDFRFQQNTTTVANDKGARCVPELYLGKGRPVDIMFVLDNSGTMYDKQTEICSKIKTFASNLIEKKVDAKFGLVRFGMSYNGTYVGIPDDFVMHQVSEKGQMVNFTDTSTFRTQMMAYNQADGRYEYGYDAMNLAIGADYRPAAQKIVVFVSDENVVNPDGVTPNENAGKVAREVLIKRLNENGIIVFSYIPNLTEYDKTYAAVATATGGERYDIGQTFDDLHSKITTMAGATYTLRYCPADTAVSARKHFVSIALASNPTLLDADSYVASPDKEYIVRTASTINQESMILLPSVAVNFCFNIYDNLGPYASSITLMARKLGSTTPFVAYSMSASSSMVNSRQDWCGTVPAASALDPGIEYYAIAKYPDGHEVKSPAVAEEYFAWTQAITPNRAPVVTVTSTALPVQCIPYNLSFTVSDATGGVAEVAVYTHEKGSPAGFSLLQKFNYLPTVATKNLTVAIPMTGNEGVEYYIVAKDSWRTITSYGNVTQPKLLKQSTTAVVTTAKYMTLNLANVRIQCNNLAVGDTVKAFYLNSCGGYSLAGIKTITSGTNAMLVYGNTKPVNEPKNGYLEGEEVLLKVVRKANNTLTEIDKEADILFQNGTTKSFTTTNYDPLTQVVIRGNNRVILNGDDTPSTLDGTDFGAVASGQQVTRTFNLASSGCATATFNNAYAENFIDFEASLNGNVVTVTYYGFVDATSKITVDMFGLEYSFYVSGTVAKCNETIKYGTVLVPNGDITPSVAEGTDFGSQSAATLRQFTFSSDCNSTITSVTASLTNFSVSYSGNIISLEYDVVADATGTITVESSIGTEYTFMVKGTSAPCTETVKYGTVLVANGDVTPSTTEGTDFGSQSILTTRSFTFSSSCAATLVSATSSSANFAVNYSGNTVSISYNAAATATGTISLVTSKGAVYSFSVKGTKSGATCSDVILSSNPIDSWGGNVTVPITLVAPATTMSLVINVVSANGTLVQTVTNLPQVGAGNQAFYIQGGGLTSTQVYNLVVVRGGSQCTMPFTVKQ